MGNDFIRLNEAENKINLVPSWEKSGSFKGWRQQFTTCMKASAREEIKAHILKEFLRKDSISRGLNELAINQFLENRYFDEVQVSDLRRA